MQVELFQQLALEVGFGAFAEPAVFKIVVTVSFMQPEPVGWPTFPG